MNVSSSFVTVLRSMCCKARRRRETETERGSALQLTWERRRVTGSRRTLMRQGSVTTALSSTVSTRGSRSAISLMHE